MSKSATDTVVRITTKLTLILTTLGFVLFGTYGVAMLRAEERDLRLAIEREVELLSRGLQVAVGQALAGSRAELEEMIRAIVHPETDSSPSLDVWVYDGDGRLLAATAPDPPAATEFDRTATLRNLGEEIADVVIPSSPQRLLTALPVRTPDGTLSGQLVIERTLTDMETDLRRTQRGIVGSVVTFILLTLAVGMLLGSLLISRPLSSLGAALRQVRTGDLSPALPVSRGRDEVSLLSGEFNRMVDALRDARARLTAEAESRRRMQRGLQQAEKLITVGQLSTGLAHEIGSPLQVLHGRACMLSSRRGLPDDVRANAAAIAAQAERITRIVDQLLSFARRQPARFGRVDPVSTATAVLDFLEFDARRRGIELSLEHADGLGALETDADQLQQIVFNLVSNALQATPSGGKVAVRLEHASETPAGTQRIPPSGMRLVVSDTGPGVPADERERIFEAFFTTRAERGGVGLGLAVVKTLVVEHDGRITVTEAPDGGACFTVELPRAHPMAVDNLQSAS